MSAGEVQAQKMEQISAKVYTVGMMECTAVKDGASLFNTRQVLGNRFFL